MAAAAPAAGAPGSRGRGRDGTRRRELSRPRGTAADLQPPARPVVTGGGCRSPPRGGVFRRRWRSEFLTTGAVRVRGGAAGTGGQGGAGVRGVRAPRGAESERSVPAGRGSGARKVLGEAPGGSACEPHILCWQRWEPECCSASFHNLQVTQLSLWQAIRDETPLTQLLPSLQRVCSFHLSGIPSSLNPYL